MNTHAFAVLALLVGVCSGQVLQGELAIVSDWEGAFNGLLVVPITEQITDGWLLQVRFSKPVTNLQIWDADVVSAAPDNKLYALENKSWNPVLQVGSTLSISFLGDMDGSTAPTASVVLYGEDPSESDQPAPPPTLGQSGAQLEGALRVESSWSDGFQGYLEVYIPQRVTGGWTMKVTFSKRVKNLEIWDADVTSVYRNTEYAFVNKHYNSELEQGSTLSMSILGEINVGRPPTAVVTLYPNTLHPLEPAAPTTQEPLVPTVPRVRTTDPPATVPKKPATAAATEPPRQTVQLATTKATEGTPGPYDYNEVLNKSILFYEAQRSGKLPPNNRVAWRGDSTLGDSGPNGEDLTGGWFDAGDYVKFGLPMAWSATTLAWGVVQYRDAYEEAGQLAYMLDCLRWATDYFLKCHTAPNTFYAQVGNGDIDHAYWGRPEDMDVPRPAYSVTASKPGSDVVAETAAALAASSLVFVHTDPFYAIELLNNARSLFEFADTYRGKYSDSIPDAKKFYESYSGYGDELAFAATWLYLATEEMSYLNKAKQLYNEFNLGGTPWAYSWDDNTAAVQLLLYIATNGDSTYGGAISSFLHSWFPDGSVPHTPKGLAWRDNWGSLRYAANTAFLALVAADHGISPDRARDFAETQIHYMLGDTGRSFVVGFGVNPPQQPHHAASSCNDQPQPCTWDDYQKQGPNPQVLYGALVGGPDINDNYQDVRSDYTANEVTCDYNAGFQSAVAGLKNIQITRS